MELRFATDTEINEWDSKILANPDRGNVFQSDEFAEQKKLGGWTPRYIIGDGIALTVLEKHVTMHGNMWYLPKGPGVTSAVALGDLLPALRKFAAEHGVFAVKVESEIEKTDSALLAFKELELVPVQPIQPNYSTVLIDLTPELDEVMKNLNQKGRHAIHRAERDGVTVQKVETTGENCQIFYDLLVKTAAGQGFSGSIRHFDYYLKFWQRFAAAGLGQLFFAYFDGQVVAGAFALVFGDKSTYKDGASVRVEGAYGVTHLLQWHVIEWAKEQGSILQDLCGAPPSDRIDDTSHPHYGIGRFKTSFNKHVTDYVGAYDLIVRPRQYKRWRRYGEHITKRLWYRKHHESWY